MKYSRECALIHCERDFQRISIRGRGDYKRHAELTRTRFCTRTYTYVHICLLGRYSRVRDAHGPQGRAMLHREPHYVYAHSLHCASFPRTLSVYLSLDPTLSLSLFLSLLLSHSSPLRTFFSHSDFLHRPSCAIFHFRCYAHFLRGFLSYFDLSFLLFSSFRGFT